MGQHLCPTPHGGHRGRAENRAQAIGQGRGQEGASPLCNWARCRLPTKDSQLGARSPSEPHYRRLPSRDPQSSACHTLGKTQASHTCASLGTGIKRSRTCCQSSRAVNLNLQEGLGGCQGTEGVPCGEDLTCTAGVATGGRNCHVVTQHSSCPLNNCVTMASRLELRLPQTRLERGFSFKK